MASSTSQSRSEQAEICQYSVLEKIAQGAPLNSTLEELTRMLEHLLPGSLSSILILDEDGQRLKVAAAPSMPADYSAAVDGLLIGPKAGSCGTAAYLKIPVLVSDIESDPLWTDFRELALSHGLRACWSTPILSQSRPGATLGTFAVYSTQPGCPDPDFLKWMGRAEHLACLALEADIAARNLRQSEAKFRVFVDNASDSMFLHDQWCRVLNVNRRACESLQYQADELIGMTPLDFDPNVGPEQLSALLDRLKAGDEFTLESAHRRRDGTIFPVEVRLRPFFERGQRYCLALVSDISERKQAEAALERQRQFLLETQKLAGLGCFEWDLGSNALTWSEELCHIYGVDPQTFKPTLEYFMEQVHPEDRAALQEKVQTAIRDGSAFHGEERILRPNGEIRILESNGRVVLDTAGQPARVVGACLDITERRKLEEQLRDAQRIEAVGRLAGGIAHDFNNLLTVINGFADLLKETNLDDANREAIVAIRDAGARAASLTAQLLAFSRRTIVEPRILDVNALVNKSATLIRRLIGENISVITELDNRPATIKIDPGQLEQVIMNLVVNARDAMGQGGQLTIRSNAHYSMLQEAGKDQRYVELTVTDTGEGIPDEVRSNIFEPFFTTKGLGRGTGLGLSVVHGVVTRSGGQILVHSQLGKGTTFQLLFPHTQLEEAKPPGRDRPRQESRGHETILLVEDEDAVRRIARLALEGQGYRVLPAALGKEALLLAEESEAPIDLLLTDVVMPEMGGGQLAKLMRERNPHLPVLYMSGYTDDAMVLQGITATTESFLQKPFTPAALVAKVRALLDSSVVPQ